MGSVQKALTFRLFGCVLVQLDRRGLDQGQPIEHPNRLVGLIRFLGHLERGGYDGPEDGESNEERRGAAQGHEAAA